MLPFAEKFLKQNKVEALKHASTAHLSRAEAGVRLLWSGCRLGTKHVTATQGYVTRNVKLPC